MTISHKLPFGNIFQKDAYYKITNDLQILENDVKYFILCNKAHAMHPVTFFFARQERLKAYSARQKRLKAYSHKKTK